MIYSQVTDEARNFPVAVAYRGPSGEADKELMSALARCFPEANLHVIDLPYRLSSWALDDSQNVRLWFVGNRQLVAWAILQPPFWTLDYALHPEYARQLHEEILSWGDERARAVRGTSFSRPSWYVNVFSGQADRIRDLEGAGFMDQSDVGEDSWSKVLMRRASRGPVKSYLPPAGFTVRPLAGEAEVPGYVDLHRAVFESRNMTADWRRRMLRHPRYRPDLDIVVEAPDGRLVAFCICWFDEELRVGQVEPLGSHKDFRQYGLGRVALSEGLRRLQSLGAQSLYVETDNYRNTARRLYESFDFEVVQDVLVYRKDYPEAGNP